MTTPDNAQNVIEIIQLALTPVFLIVGIGQLLNVVTNRVARIIDRARWLNNHNSHINQHNDSKTKELAILDKRLKFANWAITFLTGAAVIICLDIVLLIANGLINTDLAQAVLILFITSIASITGGLFSFFIEVSLATATLKVNLKQIR
ncbi:MAG: DUF2721 domain-containing protein [Porticoccaceae bacterium]|nr:DUF2721 domain-containing protein [Porticoccaceae bacterium]MDG1473979.1 DUF2721 domain-containing protein [Porticoccaceae bacterium]